MRKIIFLGLFIAAACFANGQGRTLYKVNMLMPRSGMQSAFEESWKSHLAKFHSQTDKRRVYEVMSGPETGSYVVVEGPISYASMDTVLPTAKDHRLDLEKTFSPELQSNNNMLVRWVDTLSYKGDVHAELSVINIIVIKDGKLSDYMAESRKTILLYTKLNAPFSFNALVRQQAGSSPTIVLIRNLKDGYKELDQDYFHLPMDWFKTNYIKEYGQAAWDNRVKLFEDITVSRTQHFEKFRADLSSK
jgi:hypothetical protein